MFGDFNVSWDYAWWFPAVYTLITVIFMVIYGKSFIKKFFRFPGGRFKWKIPTIISSSIFSRGILAYAIFIPLKINTAWFWIGVVIFGITIIFTNITMVNFASTPHNQPVVKGMYRVSRHPIQVLAIIMSLGIGIATISWIILGASLLLVFLSYPTFLAQERSCLEMYGNAYRDYLKKTPRWFRIPKSQ